MAKVVLLVKICLDDFGMLKTNPDTPTEAFIVGECPIWPEFLFFYAHNLNLFCFYIHLFFP